MRHFSVMIKPASSLCNLKCSYCFYSDVSSRRNIASYGIMSSETVASALSNIFCDLEANDGITFVFQGGEPLLAGIEFFECFINAVTHLRGSIHVEYTIQTNGTLLNEAWCEFLKKNDFLVGLSLDGFEGIHNKNRVDMEGMGTYQRVLEAKKLLNKYHVEYNIIVVLTNTLAEQPKRFWEAIRVLDVSYVQIIPCLNEFEDKSPRTFSLESRQFACFYTKLFEYWKQDYDRNRIVSIKLFDDILNLLVYKRCTACGMTGHCSAQIVIEADGSVYPCDFYALDEQKIGNIVDQTLFSLLSSQEMNNFLKRPRTKMSLCETCYHYAMCGGGCERMSQEVCGVKDSSFCGYKSFLDAKVNDLYEIAKQVTTK